MGAWAEGPFDNDDAADWAGDLDESTAPETLIGPLLDQVVRAAYVDVAQANRTVATAAWLASGTPGGPAVASSYSPSSAPPAVGSALARLVVAAVERATSDGFEWRELWDEAAQTETALAAIEPALQALRSVT